MAVLTTAGIPVLADWRTGLGGHGIGGNEAAHVGVEGHVAHGHVRRHIGYHVRIHVRRKEVSVVVVGFVTLPVRVLLASSRGSSRGIVVARRAGRAGGRVRRTNGAGLLLVLEAALRRA